MGYYEICFRIARYSKANLGITHTESLLAGYIEYGRVFIKILFMMAQKDLSEISAYAML